MNKTIAEAKEFALSSIELVKMAKENNIDDMQEALGPG